MGKPWVHQQELGSLIQEVKRQMGHFYEIVFNPGIKFEEGFYTLLGQFHHWNLHWFGESFPNAKNIIKFLRVWGTRKISGEYL